MVATQATVVLHPAAEDVAEQHELAPSVSNWTRNTEAGRPSGTQTPRSTGRRQYGIMR